jgi:hypothetical protein
MVNFDEESHTYTSIETGKKYTSVTTLIGKYREEFESEKHAARVAKREGLTTQFVLDMWQDMNDKANEKGTRIHKIMEQYILEDPHILPDDRDEEEKAKYEKLTELLYSTYDRNNAEYIGKYNLKKTHAEVVMSDDEFELAGMADIIYECKANSFYIGDFKTNKKFNFNSRYGEFLKSPLDHLQACQFNEYAIQLSTYAFMRERESGQKCNGIIIHYLEKNGWKPIYINYLKSDVEKMLKHHKASLNS